MLRVWFSGNLFVLSKCGVNVVAKLEVCVKGEQHSHSVFHKILHYITVPQNHYLDTLRVLFICGRGRATLPVYITAGSAAFKVLDRLEIKRFSQSGTTSGVRI